MTSVPAGTTVRPARAADIDPVVSLLWDVGREGRWIGLEVPFDRHAYRDRLRGRLGRDDRLLLVADDGGDVVGELTMDLASYGTAELGMALRSGWRGHGLGSAMLVAGIDWARAAGAGKVALEVWPDNEPARSLYRRHDFVDEGRKRHHYRRRNQDVWDSVLMGLTLDRSPWPIRPATDGDGWELVALVAACWSEYPGCIMDPHGECPELLAPASAFAAEDGLLWVVEGPGEEVIASVGLVPTAAGAELQKLYVARRVRRRGLARHLAGLVETEAARRGARHVELWSDTRFTDAHRLYEAMGYGATGNTRNLEDRSATTEMHFAKEIPDQ